MLSEDRARIIDEARTWIGTPYQHQASLRGIGCDCLGLVRGIWRALIGPEPELMPPYTPDWAEASGHDRLMELASRHFEACDGRWKSGDVLLFRFRAGLPVKHVAIALSDTSMIHAHDGASVAQVTIVPSWRRRIVAAYSFPTLQAR